MTDKIQEQIDTANSRYQKANSYWEPLFKRIAEEKRFLCGDQWDSQLKVLRETDGRPCVQVPRLSNFVRQLHSQIRQSEVEIDVNAENNGTKQQADIIKAIIKKIENQSSVENSYDQAGLDSIVGGWGVLRVYGEYKSKNTFDQDLFIESIYDPTTVFFDPNSTCPIFSDSKYAFIEAIMTKEEYAQKIGQKSKILDTSKLVGFSTKLSPNIIDDEHISVLEYYYKEYKEDTIYKLQNVITGETAVSREAPDPSIMEIVVIEKRKIEKCIIHHCLFDGVEFHNQTIIPGECIPLVPVVGETTFINRVRFIKGAVRDSLDTQRILNYTASTQLEMIDLAPKSPWLVTDDAIAGYEDSWQDANSRNYSYLVYNSRASAPPQRMPAGVDVGPIAAIKAQAENDLQAVFGVYDASLGNASNEISGTAINARVNQSNKSTFVYKDNLHKAIKQIGKVLVEMIPHYYNGRVETLSITNGTDVRVPVEIDPNADFQVDVIEIKNTETQRQELNSELLKLAQAIPQVQPLIADYIVKNSDITGTEPLVARLSTLLPPEIRQMESQNINDPRQLQSVLNQKAQEAQQLNATLQQLQMQLQQLQVENDKLKSDNSLEQQKLEQDRQKAQMEYQYKNKALQIDATKMKLDFDLSVQQQKLEEHKLMLEAVGVNTDQLSTVSLE